MVLNALRARFGRTHRCKLRACWEARTEVTLSPYAALIRGTNPARLIRSPGLN